MSPHILSFFKFQDQFYLQNTGANKNTLKFNYKVILYYEINSNNS